MSISDLDLKAAESKKAQLPFLYAKIKAACNTDILAKGFGGV